MRLRSFAVCLCVVAALASLASLSRPVYGQLLRGRLTVTVRDGSQAKVAQARLRLVNQATGQETVLASDANGEFLFPGVAPGEYRVTVEAPGFRRSTTRVQISVQEEKSLHLNLQPGDATEEITVLDRQDSILAESAAIGTLVENRAVMQLPLDGRNFYELTLLAPGISAPAQGSAGTARGDFAFQANGNRESANNYTLDGVYNGDPKLNGVGVTPPVDGIAEFRVATGQYDAAYSRNAGAQVNVAMKSGTNSFHGTAYEFFRGAGMDARAYFANAGSEPQYRRNQFGGSAGGAIVKNRSFFFGDVEQRRVTEGIVRATRVPTAAERRGDFSQSDPRTPPIDLFTQAPFPGSRIPANRLHPIALGIANLYPAANRTEAGQNYVGSPNLTDLATSADGKLDQYLTAKDQLMVRYSFNDRDLFEPYAGATFSAVPGFGTNSNRRAHNVAIAETHAFSPRVLNEFRAGFNRVAFGALHEKSGTSTSRTLGLPEPSAKQRDWGLPFISVAGYSSLGDEYNNPQFGVTNSTQILNQTSVLTGRHLWQFGGDARVLQQNAYRDVLSRGLISFVGFTGNALAEMMQGLVSVSSVASVDNQQYLRSRSAQFFAQDTFRVTPELTLQLGVRYEYARPPVDAQGRATVFDSGTRSIVPYTGLTPDRNNWAPRFGFAYRPGAGKTVVRGGYGIYFDQQPLAPGEGIYFNPPYFNLGTYFTFQQYSLLLHDVFPRNFPLALPPSVVTFQKNLQTAYVQQFSFGIQQEWRPGTMAEISYVGTKGSKLLAGRDINQAAPSTAQQNLRPDPRFGDITAIESRANSNYHALQARVEQRVRRGLSFLASYTLAKSIDDASGFFASAADPNFPMDSNNVRLERARSGFDVRQRAAINAIYDLPFTGGRLARGWQVASSWVAQSGQPFTVSLLSDLDQSNTGRTSFGFGANDRPNRLRSGVASERRPEAWFDTGAFALQPFGTLGNAGRNILDGPGLFQWNASVQKETALGERTTLQLRFEAFNVTNRANFDLPDSTFGSGTFGRVLSAKPPRRLQLGARFIW